MRNYKYSLTFLILLTAVVLLVSSGCSLAQETSEVNNDEDVDHTTVISISPRLGASSFCNCTSLFQCDVSNGGGGGSSPPSSSGSAVAVSNQKPGGDGILEASAEEVDYDEDDGANLEVINIRNGLQPCKHYLEICCNLYQQRPQQQQKPRSKPARPALPTDVGATSSFPSPESPTRHCGRRNIHGVGFRIVGNIEGEAQMGEFTWMIAVTELSKDKEGTVYLCGGSLIHPRVVLTAAHCVENKDIANLRIRAGEWDTQTEREEPYVHYDRHVDKVIIHEQYTKRTVLKNDIAIILLSRQVPITRHIGPVCLLSDLTPQPGQRCFASGWGKNLYGKEGSYQSILKKVDLPIVPRDECQNSLRNTALGPKFRLHPSFVCAGGEKGKDTCKGDGGSPLVCQVPGSDRYALYGIVSWGLNCGDPIPGVYVNVPYFVTWIENHMNAMGLETSYFEHN